MTTMEKIDLLYWAYNNSSKSSDITEKVISILGYLIRQYNSTLIGYSK